MLFKSLSLALALSTSALAQNPVGKISFQPSGVETKDAVIWNRGDAVAKNFGGDLRFQAGTWTWDKEGLGQGTFRSLIAFDMSLVPKGAQVISSRLRLTHDTTGFSKGHSSLSASNASWLLRVKEAWSESTVTWANQPGTDTVGRALLAQNSGSERFLWVDVTVMVGGMLSDSFGNHGFMLRSVEEKPYNMMVFASGDNEDVSFEPILEIEFRETTTGTRASANQRKVTLRLRDAGTAQRFGGGGFDARGRTVVP